MATDSPGMTPVNINWNPEYNFLKNAPDWSYSFLPHKIIPELEKKTCLYYFHRGLLQQPA